MSEKPKIKLKLFDQWASVRAAARTTVGKEDDLKEPSNKWKKTILLAEHSPIRLIEAAWEWFGLKYWVSVHFVRHWLGIVHFVSTQRTDRTGVDREDKPQSALVNHKCHANAQALINISRKRLCMQAAPDTREAWAQVKNEIAKRDPVLASVMVPECVYRGFCPEFKSCGYCETEAYREALEAYRRKDV